MLSIEGEKLKKRWIDYCSDINHNSTRETSVGNQFNRDAWQISDMSGRITISKSKSVFTPYWLHAYYFNRGSQGFSITEEIYNELKNIYFGNYKPNEEYLLKLNASFNQITGHASKNMRT